MSRLTRDGTAEPISRDHILGRERGQRKLLFFYVQLTTSRIGNHTGLIDPYPVESSDDACIHGRASAGFKGTRLRIPSLRHTFCSGFGKRGAHMNCSTEVA